MHEQVPAEKYRDSPHNSQTVYVERENTHEPNCCGTSIRMCLLLLLGIVIIIQSVNIFSILFTVVQRPDAQSNGIYFFTAFALVFLLMNIFGFWANSTRNVGAMLLFLMLYVTQSLYNAAYNLYYIFSTPQEIRNDRGFGYGTFTVTLILNFIVFWKLLTHWSYCRATGRGHHQTLP